MGVELTVTIPYRDLSVGDHRFEFVVGDTFFEGFGGELVNGGQVRAEVNALRKASGMELTVNLTGEARVECDRCLEPLSLSVDWQGEVPVRVDAARAGEYDGETLFVAPGDGSVDLSQWVYESVCLGLPMTRVHPDGPDGVSLCDPDMLARFRPAPDDEPDGAMEYDAND